MHKIKFREHSPYVLETEAAGGRHHADKGKGSRQGQRASMAGTTAQRRVWGASPTLSDHGPAPPRSKEEPQGTGQPHHPPSLKPLSPRRGTQRRLGAAHLPAFWLPLPVSPTHACRHATSLLSSPAGAPTSKAAANSSCRSHTPAPPSTPCGAAPGTPTRPTHHTGQLVHCKETKLAATRFRPSRSVLLERRRCHGSADEER